MTQRDQIKTSLLKALHAANGTPMPDAALKGAGMVIFPVPTLAEVKVAIKELEQTDEFIHGTDTPIIGREWALTSKGKLQAQQL